MPIRQTLVFLCSPHPDGVTDTLGLASAAGLKAAGINTQVIRLREKQIQPCRGCGACLENGGICLLAPDDAESLFSAMQDASALLFAAPVYFYALPGQFKIFIDRSQKFWNCLPVERIQARSAGIIMAAARKRGEKLFSGSLLTLKWFLKPFGFGIRNALLLRGLETVANVQPADLDAANVFGLELAKAIEEGQR